MDGVNGFDGWLDQQLQEAAGSHVGPSPLPAQAVYQTASWGGPRLSVLARAATLISAKGAAGIALAMLAAGAVGAAAEAAVTGSPDPTVWGQQVKAQVVTCTDALAPGSHGIGSCVSKFAKLNGDKTSDAHQASGARTHTPGPPSGHPGPGNHPGSGHHTGPSGQPSPGNHPGKP